MSARHFAYPVVQELRRMTASVPHESVVHHAKTADPGAGQRQQDMPNVPAPAVDDVPRAQRALMRTVFCVDDNFSDQPQPRRAGLALQRPAALEQFLTGAPIEEVLITAADPRAVVPSGSLVRCPRGCDRLDVGVSLGVIVGESRSIAGYVAVLDFMRLDIPQTQTYLARSFPTHKVVGQPVGQLDPAAAMRLQIDGELRQDSSLSSMIATPLLLVATIARHYELQPGDLVVTGSPAGRPADTDGPWIAPGSVVHGEIAGVGTVVAQVVAEPGG